MRGIGRASACVGFAGLAGVLACCGGAATSPPAATPTATPAPSASPTPEPILVESLPGSVYHSPDGTWWGYNQSKVVRFGQRVFTYVIHNDASPNSRFTVY